MLVLYIDERKYLGVFEEAISKIESSHELEVRTATPAKEDVEEYLLNPQRTDVIFVALGRTVETSDQAIGIVKKMHEKNPFMMVVFVADGGFVPLSVYRVPHVFAIRKPITSDDLTKAFKQISYWHNLNRSQSFGNNIIVKWYTEKIKVSEDSIISVRSEKYGLLLTTVHGTYKHSGKLDEILKAVRSGTFFRCQSNVVVNFKHVKRVYKDQLEMDNGDVISVSRQYKKPVHEFVKNGLTNDQIIEK